MAIAAALCLAAPLRARAGDTIVTLTFDDTLEDNFQLLELLRARGMRATFYVNSGRIGQPKYMTIDQLRLLEAAGNEIGGHTVNHVDVPLVDHVEQRRQICNDRVALLGMGFRATTFAYPHGDADPDSESVAKACGYNAARRVGDLLSPDGCTGCDPGETVPPRDPYKVRTPSSVQDHTTLEQMQGLVMQVEVAGGGWMPLVLHHVCDGCNAYAVSPAVLSAFLDWLAPRAASGTVVKTMAEVVGGDLKPGVPGPPPEPPVAGANLLRNPSLELDDNLDAVPNCWERGGEGSSTVAWTGTSDAQDGARAQRLEVSNYVSGARRLVTLQDLGFCSPPATPGHRYRVSVWYKTGSHPRFVAYYRLANGAWRYWTQSERLPPMDGYTKAVWTTPAAPFDAAGFGVGLALAEDGSLTVDDFDARDIGPPPAGCLGQSAPGAEGGAAGIAGLLLFLRWTRRR